MNNNKKQNEEKRSRVDFRVLAMWVLIIAGLTFLLVGVPGGDGSKSVQELTIRQTVEYAQAKNLPEVTIRADTLAGDRFYRLSGNVTVGEKNQKFNAAGRVSDDEYAILRANVPKFTEEAASSTLRHLLIAVLPTLIVFGIISFLIFRTIRRSQAGHMAFGRSRAKLLDKEKSKVTFADVAGCDESKEEVAEVVSFLKDAKRFAEIGGRIPKGVLLVGPPGTGKTLLARAVAGEADVPFFSISGSDFVEMFVGVGASRVRDTFEQARKNAPCIIFIDEIDAVGRQRGSNAGGGTGEWEQTLNSLLVEMDGVEPQEGIIVIAATNRPDVLDAALLRPGRFDRQVYVDLPDLKGREAVLAVHAKRFKIAEDVSLVEVAKSTTGFSGADLANLLNEAALVAVRNGKRAIDKISIGDARDKISYGRERRRMMDEKDRTTTAYHEAGHAIVQVLISDGLMNLQKVTIIPRGGALGMAMFMPEKDILGYSEKQLRNLICTSMAGRIGERVFTGDISSGASSDLKNASSMARRMVREWGMSEKIGPVTYNEERGYFGINTASVSESTLKEIDAEVKRILSEEFQRAEELIAKNSEAHKKIAEALLEYETLDGIHVKEIVEFGEIKTPVAYKSTKQLEQEKNEASTVPANENASVPAEENPSEEDKTTPEQKETVEEQK